MINQWYIVQLWNLNLNSFEVKNLHLNLQMKKTVIYNKEIDTQVAIHRLFAKHVRFVCAKSSFSTHTATWSRVFVTLNQNI